MPSVAPSCRHAPWVSHAGRKPAEQGGSILLYLQSVLVELDLNALRLGLLVVDVAGEHDHDHDECADDEIELVLLQRNPFPGRDVPLLDSAPSASNPATPRPVR